MSENETKPPESGGDDDRREYPNQQDETIMQSSETVETESLFSEIERFSSLSSDLKSCLFGIISGIKDSMDQMQSIRQEVQRKKKELKQIHGIEVSADALERLVEEQRSQKEKFDKFMENQRRVWEEEKRQREVEDANYRETLEMQRLKEQEEYKHKWIEEQATLRKKREDEIRALERRSLENLEGRERKLSEREQGLKEKEREWKRLVQELELFMTTLASRTRNAAEDGSIDREGLPELSESLKRAVDSDDSLRSGDPEESRTLQDSEEGLSERDILLRKSDGTGNDTSNPPQDRESSREEAGMPNPSTGDEWQSRI